MHFLDRVEVSRNHLARRIDSRIWFTVEKISLVQLIVLERLLIAKVLVLQLGSAVGRNLGVGK